MEDGNFRVSQVHGPQTGWNQKIDDWDSWSYLTTSYLTANQKKVMSASLTPKSIKSSTNYQGVQGFWAQVTGLFEWPCNKTSSAPNSNVSICWASHTSQCTDLFGDTRKSVNDLITLTTFMNLITQEFSQSDSTSSVTLLLDPFQYVFQYVDSQVGL